MPIPTREAALLPMEPEAPRQQDEATGLALVIERLALNPEVDVVKLEKIIELQERILRHQAKATFDGAFARMQGEIPIITEGGEIEVNGQVRSTYARNEDIQRVVKPILQRHGFSLRFRNEWADNKLKIVGILSHESGHSEQDEFVTVADKSGSKNEIQAIGSARSYGQRYTTISLLNIATSGEDDDGRQAAAPEPPDAPGGYDDWYTDLCACAEEGTAKLSKMWNESRKDFRKHLTSTNNASWERLKKKAAKVGA